MRKKEAFNKASSVIRSTHIIIIIIFLLKNDAGSFVSRFICDLSRIHNHWDTFSAAENVHISRKSFIYVSFNDNVWAKEYKVASCAQKSEGGKIQAIIVTLEMMLRKLFTHINHEDMEQLKQQRTHTMRSDTKHFRPWQS
jgi:hypothetical protein